MPIDDTAASAAWLAAYLDAALPQEQLAPAVAATRRAAAAVGQRAAALAMEDEPASFVAALARLATPAKAKRS